MQRCVRQGTGKTRTNSNRSIAYGWQQYIDRAKNRLQAQPGGLAMRGKRKRLLRRLITSAADRRSR